MDKNVERLIKILKTSKGKKLLITHIKDPDGMFSMVEVAKHINTKGCILIPLNHAYLHSEELVTLLNSFEVLASTDMPPFGKSIEWFFDHHETSAKYVEKTIIKHCHFNPEAISAYSLVANTLLSEEEKKTSEQMEKAIGRTDSATYSSLPPASLEELEKCDQAWKYSILIDCVNEDVNAFTGLFNYLINNSPEEAFKREDFRQKMESQLLNFKKVVKIAKSIKEENSKEGIILISKEKLEDWVLMLCLYKLGFNVIAIVSKQPGSHKIAFGINPKFNPEYAVNDIAEKLGGGGHKKAAAAHLSEDKLESSIEVVKEEFKRRNIAFSVNEL
ncbi:MAG: DHH family phosphoesterase [Candidatus Woesearchaeota archaeon]